MRQGPVCQVDGGFPRLYRELLPELQPDRRGDDDVLQGEPEVVEQEDEVLCLDVGSYLIVVRRL